MRCVLAPRRLTAALTVLLAGCQPSLNWREVRTESGQLAVLPCKPDRGERQLPTPMGAMRLSLLGCEAGGRTFAIAETRWPEPAKASALLALWRDGGMPTARPLQAPQPVAVPGTDEAWQGASLATDTSGRPVRSDVLYLRRGGQIWQLQMLTPAKAGAGSEDAAGADARATFFGGLRP